MDLEAAWNPARAVRLSPEEIVDMAAAALEAGEIVPAAAAAPLARALRMYQAGNAPDIARNLGLQRRRRGERLPEKRERLATRNQLLAQACRIMPGANAKERAERVLAAVLSTPSPAQAVTYAEASTEVRLLLQGFADEVPRSWEGVHRAAAAADDGKSGI